MKCFNIILFFFITNLSICQKEFDCNCKDYYSYGAEFTYDSAVDSSYSLENKIKTWENNHNRFKIRSITLNSIDSLPDELLLFENLEAIYINESFCKDFSLFNQFRNLQYLNIEMSDVYITGKDLWLQNIEILELKKTRIHNLNNFQSMKNIKCVRMNCSGFEPFPSGFNEMKNLQFFSATAYTSEIDLSFINLKSLKSLKYVEFHTWFDNLYGIPVGKNKRTRLIVDHLNLTEAEKKAYSNSNHNQ